MHMEALVLSGAALLACGSLVFAGPLSRRQDIKNNLLAPINPDGMNTLPNTPITIASLLTPPAADHFPAGPLVLPEYPINNIGNTLTANTLTGTGFSTNGGIIQAPQQAATNFVDQLGNPQSIASTLIAATSFEADVQQKLKSIKNPDNNKYCIWELSTESTNDDQKLLFKACGQGYWKEFSTAVDNSGPGYVVYRLGDNTILSVMNRLHNFHRWRADAGSVDMDTHTFLTSYKTAWVRLLRTVFQQTVSRDDVTSKESLDAIGNAISSGGYSPLLEPDPPPQNSPSPLGRREETNDLLGPVNTDLTNTRQNTLISLAQLPTPPNEYSFSPSPGAPVTSPDYSIQNIGNTFTASSVPGIGSSTGDGIQVPQEFSTYYGNLITDPQPIASTLIAATSFAEDVQQKLQSIKKLDTNRYCIWELSLEIQNLAFKACGAGYWKEFSLAVDRSGPGYAVYRLGDNTVLSVMNMFQNYWAGRAAVTVMTYSFLTSYKENWVRLLHTVFQQTVSKDDVNSMRQLDEIGNAISSGGYSPLLEPDPDPQ